MTLRFHKIRLEASSFCQLRCPSCPTTSGAIHPAIGSGFLSLSHFQKLLDDNPRISEVQLANYGEIFLNPELLDIMRYAYERGVKLRADTGANLNHVPPDVLEGLVTYQFRSLTCSIDGASDDTYQRYRARGSFHKVMENIRQLNAHKQRYRSPYPHLTWQFIVFGHNEHELPAARKLAQALHMDFRSKLSWDKAFSPVRNADFVRREVGQHAATRDEYRQKRRIAYADHLCHELWEEPQINWDGKILGCSRNFWGDFGGNAFKDGLTTSLNHEKMVYARRMLVGKEAARSDIPCTRCDIYLTRQANGKRLKRGLPRMAYRIARGLYRLLRTLRNRTQIR